MWHKIQLDWEILSLGSVGGWSWGGEEVKQAIWNIMAKVSELLEMGYVGG